MALTSAALLALTVAATAQESGGAASGGATSSAPTAPPAPPAPQETYTPPPPPPPAPSEVLAGGWYVGAGAGWDGQNEIKWEDTFGNYGHFDTHDNPVLVGSIGYKFPGMAFRLEAEGGYTWHDISSFHDDSVIYSGSGNVKLGHVLVNGLYDIPVAPRLAISVGAGVGAGFGSFEATSPVTASMSRTGFMWQAIGGVTYKVGPQLDLFADYRYRDAQTGGTIPITSGGSVHIHGLTDNVVLAGLRWYLSPQPE